MDNIDIAVAEENRNDIDLEKGPLSDIPDQCSTPRASPVTTSSTVFTQTLSETTSSRFQLNALSQILH
jgi:hypothetical protein